MRMGGGTQEGLGWPEVLLRSCLLSPVPESQRRRWALARAPRAPSWRALPHLTGIAPEAQRGRPHAQGHTGTGLSGGPCLRGASVRPGPPRGGAGRAPPAPRPRGAARGAGGGSERSGEECERAGRAAGAAGTAGRRPARASARCRTSPWCRWTGRGAATMTTSRGSVGWTTGSARSGRTRTVRPPGPGGRDAGHARPPLAHARSARAHVGAGPTFRSRRRRRHLPGSGRADTFSGPLAPAAGPPSPPQLLPCGPRAGVQTWPGRRPGPRGRPDRE